MHTNYNEMSWKSAFVNKPLSKNINKPIKGIFINPVKVMSPTLGHSVV